MEEYLFNGNYDKYINSDNLMFYCDVQEKLNEKAKETKNKKTRIHYLLNEVYDEYLQKCINDLFLYNSKIAMIGYTTNDLLSYYTTSNNKMDDIHDYRKIISDEKRKTLRRNMI